jgi:hypothetical protein
MRETKLLLEVKIAITQFHPGRGTIRLAHVKYRAPILIGSISIPGPYLPKIEYN